MKHELINDQSKSAASDLLAELQQATTPREAAVLADAGEKLGTIPQPQRSRLAHAQSWQMLADRIAHAEGRTPAKQPWYRRRRVFLPAGLAVMAVLCIVFVVAQNSLPGDATYAIKRGIESAQLTLAFSSADKANTCSMQMKRRANELAQLSNGEVKTATVQQLNQSILNEAAEYKNYALAAGSGSSQLQDQRSRDITYVIEALRFARSHTKDAQQKALMDDTITALTS
jgi:hypothetical protein